MEQTFNERHAGEILKPCNIDAYIRIDERGVWPKAEYDETEGPDLFLWSPAQAFRGEPGAPEEADTPMLPLPSFTARDLAAFMVEGVGALVAGHYGEWDDGPDPASLKKIDPRSHAQTAIVQAYAARREAQRIVGAPPLALIAEADRARKAYNEATTKANIREGVSDSIPGTEDSAARLERAKASTAALDSEMEATAEAARAAQEAWLNAMVRQLLQRPATPAPVETVEQRCTRYLALLEDEERHGKRGALARVASREGVDRSNMSKDIEKARAARASQTRAGAWTSQLVQDGKRQN